MPATTEEQNEMKDEVVPKKGRGRPKRNAAPEAKEKKASEPAPKRGRGRPATTKKPEEAEKVVEPEPEPEKDEEPESAPEPAPAPAKRGRGKAAGKTAKKAEKDPKESDEKEEDAENPEPEAPVPAKGKGRGKKANGHTVDDAESAVKDDKEGKSTTEASNAKVKLIVEHCKSCHTYRNRADEVITALRAKWPNLEVEFNPNGQRKGAFEFNLIHNDGSDVNIYSGLNLGPPRKLKFPEPEKVVEALEKVYKAQE